MHIEIIDDYWYKYTVNQEGEQACGGVVYTMSRISLKRFFE